MCAAHKEQLLKSYSLYKPIWCFYNVLDTVVTDSVSNNMNKMLKLWALSSSCSWSDNTG